MARSGIIITDRWCDKPRSTPEKIMLFPREDRCPKEHRYLALAWDPRADPTKSGNRRGRYESATFATSAEANTWATSRRAQFIQGTSSATKAIWEEVGKEFLTSLKLRTERPITERYLAQMKQMIDAVTGLGVKDISQQNFPSIIERWLYSLTSKKNWQKKACYLAKETSPGRSNWLIWAAGNWIFPAIMSWIRGLFLAKSATICSLYCR